MKNVLMISASPRKGGNSDLLLDEFGQGAADAGNTVEKIYLCDSAIGYCMGCGVCMETHACVQKDDMAMLLDKMVAADVIALASPVYFYCICAQMKTFIDRCAPRYAEIADKMFYLLLTAADADADGAFDESLEAFNGFLRCLDGAHIGGIVRGEGVFKPGEVVNTPAMRHAYEYGADC